MANTFNKREFAARYTDSIRRLMDTYDELVALGTLGTDLGYMGENNGPGNNPLTEEDLESVPLNVSVEELYTAMAVLSNVKSQLSSAGRSALNRIRK